MAQAPREGREARHDVPAHHRAAAALDAYIEAAELEEPRTPLFQSVDPAGRRLTGRALERQVVLAMIKRRSAAVGDLNRGARLSRACQPAARVLHSAPAL